MSKFYVIAEYTVVFEAVHGSSTALREGGGLSGARGPLIASFRVAFKNLSIENPL